MRTREREREVEERQVVLARNYLATICIFGQGTDWPSIGRRWSAGGCAVRRRIHVLAAAAGAGATLGAARVQFADRVRRAEAARRRGTKGY